MKVYNFNLYQIHQVMNAMYCYTERIPKNMIELLSLTDGPLHHRFYEWTFNNLYNHFLDAKKYLQLQSPLDLSSTLLYVDNGYY